MTDMTHEQIEAALAAGILSPAQAKSMKAKAMRTKGAQTDAFGAEIPTGKSARPTREAALIGDEENMRFVRSFSDVFIAIGIGLLCLGLFATIGMMGGGALFLGGGVLIWVMCEYFGRVKRAHLPTLLLAFAFLIFVHSGAKAILPTNIVTGVMSALVTLFAMLVFYWRFRLPFCMALIALSLIILAFTVVGDRVPAGVIMIASGLALFCTALIYDARDTARLTRFADNAFWLHFTAAPLIIHGIAVHVLRPEPTTIMGFIPMVALGKGDAIFMLGIIAVLAVIGLAINRRALLVSSLGYAGFALGFLIKDTGLSFGSVASLTLLLLGGGIVFLGVGWHAARRVLLMVLPTFGIFGKMFPPVNSRSG